MTSQEQGPDFNWESPGKRERLQRLGNRLLYFFNRKRIIFPPPEPNIMDQPPEQITEKNKDDWYFPEHWLEPKDRQEKHED